MKTLILLLFLFPISLLAQDNYFAKDKACHFVATFTITMAATDVARELKMKDPEIKGLLLALTIGMGKEFIVDKTPSAKDLLANFTGAIAGYYINKLIHKRR